MRHVGRKILFFVFLCIFFIAAPVIVLYTAGYRYNGVNGRIVRTGVLAVSSMPRGARITLDGDATAHTTPYIFSRIMPGNYTVTLTKDGFHTFEDTVSVQSGKTSYIFNVGLFAVGDPLLLAEEKDAVLNPTPDGTAVLALRKTGDAAEAWRYTLRDDAYTLLAQFPLRQTDDAMLTTQSDGVTPELYNATQNTRTTFTPNGAVTATDDFARTSGGYVLLVRGEDVTEVRDLRTPEVLKALIPAHRYTIAQAVDSRAIVRGDDNSLLAVDVGATSPLLVRARAAAYDWNAYTNTLAWTDGIEVYSADTLTGATTFMTRQSTPFVSVALSDDGATLFTATATTLTSLTRSNDQVHATTLATFTNIEHCFTTRAAPNTIYIIGTLEGVRGIYALALR